MARDPLVLASRSPQRRAILAQIRLPFEVADPDYEEHPIPSASSAEVVRERALGKARSVAARVPGRLVLGVDTEVSLEDGVVLGKPGGPAQAFAMLRMLAGRMHRVHSGLALLGPGVEDVSVAVTDVHVRPLGDPELAAYVALGEWEGRAGGYAIQGAGAALVERIEGCYWNVVGLPAALLASRLAALDRSPPGPGGDRFPDGQ
jgi:septum formation protein